MFFCSHATGMVLCFSDKGIVYSARAYKIPECTRNAAGTPSVIKFGLGKLAGDMLTVAILFLFSCYLCLMESG
jgi:DNA gyrase/topoisomerase IV subunit A